MNNKRNDLDFELLGFKVKLKANEAGEIAPGDVVSLVREEANLLLDRSPNLSSGEAAILVALKLAYEKLGLEREYRDNVEKLETAAGEALQFIEEVSPSTI